MHPDLLTILWVLVLVLIAFNFGKRRGRKEALCIRKEALGLKEGDTFLGVVDQGRGHYFFISRDMRKEKDYE